MKNTKFLAAALAAAALCLWGGIGEAAKYTLKFNHVHTVTEPYHLAFEEWAAAVHERTNGEVAIEVYHSAQVGVEEDIIEQMRMGTALGQCSDPARMGNYVKEFAIMNLPYFVDSLDEIEKLTDVPIIKEWQKKLEDEQGIHILSFFYCQGYRNVFAHRAFRKPEDLKGQRIRSAPAQAWQELVSSLGAIPVATPYVEIYSAIQTKAVDGCENGYVAGYHGSYYEVCKYINETKHLLQINTAITSAQWFRALPPEYQQIIDEECQKAGKKVSYEIVNKLSAEAKENFKKKGTTIVEDIDLDAFRKASASAYQALGLLEARNKVYDQMGKKY